MALVRTFSARPNFGFFGGTPGSDQVPDLYPVALAGHPYLLDDGQPGAHAHNTVPDLNPRAYGFSASDQVGERTLNPDAAWRRSQESWIAGAGQRHLDADNSDRHRFWKSKGVDPWTKWQLSLLPVSLRQRQSSEVNLRLLPVGDHLYLADGTELFWTTDLATWTPTGLNAGESSALRPSSIATDGYRVWSALGANGVNVTLRGAVTTNDQNALAATVVGWCKSRLMAAAAASIYVIDPNAGTTPPSALFTHPNPDWRWLGFCEGDVAIYAAGYSGDKSSIYRIPVKSDGTGLDAPISAATLPDGEVVTGGMTTYLGFVFIGTSAGVRMAQPAASGDLQLGAVIPTTAPVRCLEGQDRFVWFGWENYDASSTGLGRMDPTVLNDSAPAYASDLMADDQGQVLSVVTWNDKRAFTVLGSGVWVEDDVPVTTGYLDTGLFSYGIADAKLAISLSTRYAQPSEGDHQVSLADDTGVFASLGSVLAGSLSAQEHRAEAFELRHTLVSDGQAGPVLRTWTLRCLPAPPSTVQLQVPLFLSEMDRLNNQQMVPRDVVAELAFLKGLRDSRAVFSYQEGVVTTSVEMTDFKWLPRGQTNDQRGWNGTFVAILTTVNQ